MYSCKTFLILLICFSTGFSCPPGWLLHGSTCYHFSHDKEDWTGAVAVCQILGGHLVEIEDATENQYLTAQAKLYNNDYWIGLNDLQEEGTWVWVSSKTRATFTNWNINEPSNSANNENCALLQRVFHWNDGPCQGNVNYICEKPEENSEIVG